MEDSQTQGNQARSLRLIAGGCGAISAAASVADSWSMASFEAPQPAVVLWLGFAGLKGLAALALVRKWPHARGAFLLCFALFTLLDLSFLAEYGLTSVKLIPWWGLRLATGAALAAGVALAITNRGSSSGARHAA